MSATNVRRIDTSNTLRKVEQKFASVLQVLHGETMYRLPPTISFIKSNSQAIKNVIEMFSQLHVQKIVAFLS